MPAKPLSGESLRAHGRARDLQAAYALMEPALAARLQAADWLAVCLECWQLRQAAAPESVETLGAYEAMREALEAWQETVIYEQVARVAG